MIAAAVLFAAVLLVAFGIIRMAGAICRYRRARLDAAYRAAVLVINARRELRAGQHRAAAREWGRAA